METFYLYGALNTETNKLVSDITNPRRKYWDREEYAKQAVNNANSKCNYPCSKYSKYNGKLKVVKIRCEVVDE